MGSDALIDPPADPGVPAGHPEPAPGVHPWAPSEFDRREGTPTPPEGDEA